MTATEITQAQLIVFALLSSGGVVGIIVKWLTAAPARESAAYKAGVADEAARASEDVAALKATLKEQAVEIVKLRNGLLRLAIAADLTVSQRADLAATLGYASLPISDQTANHKEPPEVL
jgi:IMP dehydrogenase/GMP reductase